MGELTNVTVGQVWVVPVTDDPRFARLIFNELAWSVGLILQVYEWNRGRRHGHKHPLFHSTGPKSEFKEVFTVAAEKLSAYTQAKFFACIFCFFMLI